MDIIKTSKKGHILIPKAYRKKLGIDPGAKVILSEGDNALIVRAAPADPTDAACGFLEKEAPLRDDLLAEHRQEYEHERKDRSR